MKFKRVVSAMILATMIAGVVAGCGNGTSAQSSAEQGAQTTERAEAGENKTEATVDEEVFTMQIGHAQATESPRHRSLEMFKEMVEKQTDGHVVVEIYPAGQLGDETAMTEAVSMGSLQAVRGGDLEYLPKINMLSLPMICDNLEQVRTLCYSDFVKDMLSSVETEHNMKVLAVGDDSGFRQITNSVRPILQPSDMKGLKMRTVLEVMDDSMKAFGASTVSIPFTDLYMSLKTGVCDGQENPVALIDSQKFYEVQKYCSIIDYMFCVEVMYVNLEWWNSLPAEYQAIITECSKEMMTENSRITDEENDKYIENINANGCEVVTLTKEQRDAFKPLAENVWKLWVEKGNITKEELDEMLSIVDKSVNW